MEALSPRSTNVPVKPKANVNRPKPERDAAPAAAAQKAAPPKHHPHHARPPPPIVTEPGEDGERYATGPFLGKGGFAVCYEGKLLRNGRIFAMKVVKSEMNQRKMEEKFRTELQIHSKMRHPNIVQFHRAFAFDRNTYVVLELCPNGSVMDMVRKRKCLSLPEVRRFMIQLCGAVKYMHKRNVAHRDLKMGNLFLDHNMDIKVGDFGLAAIIVTEKDEKRRRTLCGTPNYIAPEVLDKSKGGHTQKVDIWSLGVICFAMLAGYPPFQSKTQEEIYRKVRNLSYVWPKESECGNYIPTEAKTLVSWCLSLSEDERPEADQIVEHDFFNMYNGCIPRKLDPDCRFNRPVWLKSEDPRGDCMATGYSLDYDEKYMEKAAHISDPEQRYLFCKDQFFAECGVGRKPDGSVRKAAGKNSSKSAYSECIVEDERGLQPVIPLPDGFVYKYPHYPDGDWSVGKVTAREDSLETIPDDIYDSDMPNGSLRNDPASLARTQAALAAAQMRRMETQPQSHAAMLRQQALPSRAPTRKVSAPRGPPTGARPPEAMIRPDPEVPPAAAPPPGGLAERPIRPRRGVPPSYSATLRDLDRIVAGPMPTSNSVQTGLMVGKTRSQSRRQREAANQEMPPAPVPSDVRDEVEPMPARPPPDNREQYQRRPSAPEVEARVPSREKENGMPAPRRKPSAENWQPQGNVEEPVSRGKPSIENRRPSGSVEEPVPRGKPSVETRGPSETVDENPQRIVRSKTVSSGNKPRSTLGLSPLIHPDEKVELLQGSSPGDVLKDMRLLLTNLMPYHTTRRRHQPPARRAPHAYVIKWVDYTNRYGIGYVLDDGSVGCVFKAENGQPASGVVVRDGERHIRRKARCLEKRDGYTYSEADQLVPRNGKPVEFYENCDDGPMHSRGIRRVMVQPTVFEVRSSSSGSGGPGVRVRMDAGIECAKCEAEKVKRVKLVDQFGKYMIGSLGRHGDEGSLDDDMLPTSSAGHYVKFYQRLGNVGVWGFGDGAFQFNFPDHTKLVISHGRTRNSSPWIDFYHLSPSAARYLAAKGRMHPSGFDTRAVASDEAASFLAIAGSPPSSSADERLREVLDANSFVQKIEFVKDVLKGWIQCGRLGGRPQTSHEGNSHAPEIFWEGPQERPSAGGNGGKFVWVTVGAQGGDGEYVSISLKPDQEQGQSGSMDSKHEREVEALRERLKALGGSG